MPVYKIQRSMFLFRDVTCVTLLLFGGINESRVHVTCKEFLKFQGASTRQRYVTTTEKF